MYTIKDVKELLKYMYTIKDVKELLKYMYTVRSKIGDLKQPTCEI